MTDHPEANTPSAPLQVDIVIVGAGLAGTSSAIILGRAGYSIALIDTHAVYPNEFRAEKLGDPHMELLTRLGLDTVVLGAITPMDDNWIYRFGRLVAQEQRREYGFGYAALINALRSGLPEMAQLVIGRVASVMPGPEVQRVALNDGRVIEGRLLVVATGLGDVVRRAVGIKREESRKAHSLSLAFDLVQPAAAFPYQALTYFGHKLADKMAYITFFPIGETMRANLFVYREAGEAWTKEFRRNPQTELRRMMPEIVDLCADFAVAGQVEMRQIDLIAAKDYRRDGVVLLGDAFCTTCPAPGVGIQRVLTDVERLCHVHVPAWFATPGISEAKISQYYDDPVKQAMDTKGLGLSNYSRSMVTAVGPEWTFRRLRNTAVRKGLYFAARLVRQLRLGGDKAALQAASKADSLADDGWRM